MTKHFFTSTNDEVYFFFIVMDPSRPPHPQHEPGCVELDHSGLISLRQQGTEAVLRHEITGEEVTIPKSDSESVALHLSNRRAYVHISGTGSGRSIWSKNLLAWSLWQKDLRRFCLRRHETGVEAVWLEELKDRKVFLYLEARDLSNWN